MLTRVKKRVYYYGMRTHTKTFKQTMLRALVLPFAFLAFGSLSLGAVEVLAPYMQMEQMEQSEAAEAPTLDKAPAAGSPAALVEKHNCWTGEAPADMQGVIPGHVVTSEGYGGSDMVGKALEQIFEGADHNLTIYGFCK